MERSLGEIERRPPGQVPGATVLDVNKATSFTSQNTDLFSWQLALDTLDSRKASDRKVVTVIQDENVTRHSLKPSLPE